MTTSTIEIRALRASGPGALSSFGGRCHVRGCGEMIRSSMETTAILDAQRHIDWHIEQGS